MKQTPPPSSVNTIVRRFNTTTLRILLVTFFALKVFPMAIFDREGVDGGCGGGWKNLFLSTSKNLKYEQLYKGQCHCHNDLLSDLKPVKVNNPSKYVSTRKYNISQGHGDDIMGQFFGCGPSFLNTL